MRLKSLRLHNFRNFSSAHEVVFPLEPLLVAAAPNATGKTNFLESIYVLLRGKSFRASLQECVQFDEVGFGLQGRVESVNGDGYVKVDYQKETKRLKILEDEVPVSPVLFYAHYPLLLFLPEDGFLFTRGPALRRNFFNTVLISLPAYVSALVQYERALKQRNTALKQGNSQEQVEVWTKLLADYAATMWKFRRSLVESLQAQVPGLYKDFTGEELPLKISLLYGTADPETYQEALHEAWGYEQKYHYTMYGPHRDDLVVTAAGRPVKTTFSRGQMKSLVLALKVAAFTFMKQGGAQEPLLLFDELLSELDEARQRAVLHHLPHAQILLTCTHLPKELKRRDDVFMLDLRAILKPVSVKKEVVATPVHV